MAGSSRLGAAMAAGAMLMALTLIAAPAVAQKKTVTTIRVTVSVTDAKGNPVQNSLVVLRQLRDEHNRIPHDAFNVNIHTDEHGKAIVQGFEPGIVLVQVIDASYQSWGQAFIMSKPNESVYVKLKPPQAQVSTFGKGKGGGGHS